jgi:hypothetical protein
MTHTTVGTNDTPIAEASPWQTLALDRSATGIGAIYIYHTLEHMLLPKNDTLKLIIQIQESSTNYCSRSTQPRNRGIDSHFY